MKWATRAGVHVDRAACAWLILRAIDPDAVFVYLADGAGLPKDAIPFDIPGVDLSHHGSDCSFETMLQRYDLHDPVLFAIAELVHEADIEDGLYDAPGAPGLDMIIRGLSLTLDDPENIELSRMIFDGLYEYLKRQLILGRDPA